MHSGVVPTEPQVRQGWLLPSQFILLVVGRVLAARVSARSPGCARGKSGNRFGWGWNLRPKRALHVPTVQAVSLGRFWPQVHTGEVDAKVWIQLEAAGPEQVELVEDATPARIMARHAQNQIVGFGASAGLDLLDLTNATIFADGADFPGVLLAASDLCQDFSRVTGSSPRPLHLFQRPLSPSPPPSSTPAEGVSAEHAIIVGSLQSPLIQGWSKRLGFDSLSGKWEAFQTAVLDYPFPGCARALVIAGSDKRGAIYGCYTLSEQIGVSPYVARERRDPPDCFPLYLLLLTVAKMVFLGRYPASQALQDICATRSYVPRGALCRISWSVSQRRKSMRR